MTADSDTATSGFDIDRLRWQCRRGMLELDTLLEAFLDQQFAALSTAEQQQFQELLTCDDTTLQGWLLEGQPVGVVHLRDIVARLRHR